MEPARFTIRRDLQPGKLEIELREQEGIIIEVEADALDPTKEIWIVDAKHQKRVFDWLTDHNEVTVESLAHAR